MSAVIFTGPTLPAETATALLPGAIVLPPARQGDIWRVVQQHQPRAIGLIDGVFLHEPAIWHREILWALHQGVHVFGAASMGALRAAELSCHGMRGIGRVFEAYVSGAWPGFADAFEDDDEVAVIHAPESLGATPLSDALVDLRDTLLAAEAAGLLDRERRDALLSELKALPFPERSFTVLAARAPELRAWLPDNRVVRKRIDAEAMLLALAAFLRTDPPPFVPQFRFEHVQAWHDFVRHETPVPGAEAALVLEELCLQPDDRRQAAIAALARLSARTKPSAADLRRARDRFRAREKLAQRADIDAWLAGNALDEAELTRLIHDEAALDAALAAVPDATLIDHLRLTGQFSPLLRRAQAKQAALADCPPATPGPELDAALAWFDHGNLSPLRITNGMAAAIWREYLFPPEALVTLLQNLATGTRFRLFPAYAEGMPPDLVTIDLPPGSIGPGPSDAQIYVADAAAKPSPYDPPDYMPPYRAAVLPPARPNAAGHFDTIPLDTPEFLAAHLYGSVRHTLDVWQRYLGRRVEWASAAEYPQMELVPLLDWNNAQSGPGFLETGLWRGPGGATQPLALDFDVAAHETGHQILFSMLGVPDASAVGVPFLAFHESFSDLVAMIAQMHFPSVLPRLLEETQGNLYILNLINRFAETSATTQIRLASNTETMAQVSDIALAPDGAWIDPTGQGRNQHWIAAPLTGAIFDILVELYQERLVAEHRLPEIADARGWTRAEVAAAFQSLHLDSAKAWRRFSVGFVAAIRHARDQVGHALAHVMLTVRPEDLTFGEVAARFIEGLLQQGNGGILPALLDSFLARGIDPRPYLGFRPIGGARHAKHFSVAMTAHRPGCAHCTAAATLHAVRLIRAGHAATRRHLTPAAI